MIIMMETYVGHLSTFDMELNDWIIYEHNKKPYNSDIFWLIYLNSWTKKWYNLVHIIDYNWYF